MGAEDAWTPKAFDAMLLPGWAFMPFVAAAVFAFCAVGRKISVFPNVDEVPPCTENAGPQRRVSEEWLDQQVIFSWRRRYVVAVSVNAFFIATLLANGMTVRYFNLYFTEILKFRPAQLCVLNA